MTVVTAATGLEEYLFRPTPRVITAAGILRATEPAQLQRSNQLLLGETHKLLLLLLPV